MNTVTYSVEIKSYFDNRPYYHTTSQARNVTRDVAENVAQELYESGRDVRIVAHTDTDTVVVANYS